MFKLDVMKVIVIYFIRGMDWVIVCIIYFVFCNKNKKYNWVYVKGMCYINKSFFGNKFWFLLFFCIWSCKFFIFIDRVSD